MWGSGASGSGAPQGRVVASWGARSGAPVGLVSALVVALLAFGTDDVPDIVDREQLPVVYLMAAVVGVVVGAAFGVLVAMISTRVARSSTADGQGRRLRGAAAAGAAATVVTFLLVPAVLVLVLPGALILGAVAGTIAWRVLPRLVDLDAAVRTATSSRDAAPDVPVRGPLSPRQRVTRLVIVAGLGGVVVANIVASVTSQAVGLAVGLAAAAALAVFAWRSARR